MHLSDIDAPVAPPEGLRAALFETLFPPDKAAAFLRTIPGANSQPVVVSNLQGEIEWVSPAFSRMCGYTLGELRGTRPGTLLQGADTDPASVGTLREAIRDRRPVRIQLINYSKSGERYEVDLNLAPTYAADGTCTGFIAIEKEVVNLPPPTKT